MCDAFVALTEVVDDDDTVRPPEGQHTLTLTRSADGNGGATSLPRERE